MVQFTFIDLIFGRFVMKVTKNATVPLVFQIFCDQNDIYFNKIIFNFLDKVKGEKGAKLG